MISLEVFYHLGHLKWDFDSGILSEDCAFNSDETHFTINLHIANTLAMRGDQSFKYVDVVIGDESTKMMLTLGGSPDATILPPFMIFKNKASSYPISVVPGVPGLSYRSGPKGWMDQRIFAEWVSEPKTLSNMRNEKKRVTFVDNEPGHKLTVEVKIPLAKINTEIRFFRAMPQIHAKGHTPLLFIRLRRICVQLGIQK